MRCVPSLSCLCVSGWAVRSGSPVVVKGQPFTQKWVPVMDKQKSHTWRSRSSKRLSNLPKVTQLVNGKGGMWNELSTLKIILCPLWICVKPMQAAHPSPTLSSSCHCITDQGILVALFWFYGHTVVTFGKPCCYSHVMCIAFFNPKLSFRIIIM